MRTLQVVAIGAVAALLLAGCASSTQTTTGQSQAGSNPYPQPSTTVQVYGSGATFPKPLLEAWSVQYAQQSKVQVSYGAGGSGKGIKDITNKDVLFGASDAPMSASEKSAANAGGLTILQFPETLGLIAVVYNHGSIADGLRLDGETVGKIYAGSITKWNDGAIQALNPGASLPDSPIVIVYRSDSSGTTFAFTDFLAKSSSTWASKMGNAASKKPDWTKSSATQLSGNGNDGVGSTVKGTPNAIGYVELAYVQSLGLKDATMKNKDGSFVPATTAGASKAAASAGALPSPDGDWSAISIAYAPGAESYPISTFSYMMVYDDIAAYGSKATANQMAGFKAWMWWCLHEGQATSDPLGYAPLPDSVVKVGEKALSMIK